MNKLDKGSLESIKMLMRIDGVTQMQLSRVLGCDPAYLSKVLSGTVNLSEKYHVPICEYLNLDLKEFKKGGAVPAIDGFDYDEAHD